MSLRGRMFNRRASRAESMPDEVVGHLGLGPGDRVADIGSGGGYYSFRFSEIVGKAGRVFAVDTDPDLLYYVAEQAMEKGYTNVDTVLTNGFPTKLPRGGLDLVFMRNLYHHLEDPVGYMGNMRERLHPEGRVAILDYTDAARGFSFHRMFGHHVPPDRIRREMAAAGFEMERKFDFLPEQSFMIFRPA